MSVITLTTDFGTKDHYVGVLKGKIISELPNATIIDISHHVDVFNVVEASYMIASSYHAFPKGTVHIIGVDAALSSENHIAVLWEDQYFICADNGILSLLTQRIVPQKIVKINIHDRLHENATAMDVFITVACHLSKGGSMNVIGKEIPQVKEIRTLKPVLSDDGKTLKGNVIYIDHFGNVISDISKKVFQEVGGYDCHLKFAENTELFFRLDRMEPGKKEVPVPVLRYYQNSSGGNSNLVAMSESIIYILEKHPDLDPRVKRLYHQILGVNYMRFRWFSKARFHLWKAFLFRPLQLDTLARYGIAMIPFLAKRLYSPIPQSR